MGDQVKTTVKFVIQRKFDYPVSKWADIAGFYYDTKEDAIENRNYLCAHKLVTEETTRIIYRITTDIVI